MWIDLRSHHRRRTRLLINSLEKPWRLAKGCLERYFGKEESAECPGDNNGNKADAKIEGHHREHFVRKNAGTAEWHISHRRRSSRPSAWVRCHENHGRWNLGRTTRSRRSHSCVA